MKLETRLIIFPYYFEWTYCQLPRQVREVRQEHPAPSLGTLEPSTHSVNAVVHDPRVLPKSRASNSCHLLRLVLDLIRTQGRAGLQMILNSLFIASTARVKALPKGPDLVIFQVLDIKPKAFFVWKTTCLSLRVVNERL